MVLQFVLTCGRTTRQEPAQLMLIMLMVGFEVKQPLPEPARLMRIMLGLGALARAFEVKQPLSEPAQLIRTKLEGHLGKNLCSS